MTPSTTGPSARSTTAQARERSTTSTAPPETSTIKPCAPWVIDSSASCTAAYATAPSIANTPPGHTAKPPKPLDSYEPGMSTVDSRNGPGALDPASGCRRAERGVGDRLPVRLDEHTRCSLASSGALDHR